jgi:hypothetical protein
MTPEERLGIGDPTNPAKPKAPSAESRLGINQTRPNDFATNHDTYLPNGHKGSGYDPMVTTPGMNMQDVRAERQPIADKAANGLVKFGGLAGSMVAGTFTSLPWGISESILNVGKKAASGQAIDATDFTPMYDNPAANAIDAFNKTLEERFPNYASEKEQNASALSGDNLFTANFLFDKILKNSGYMVGAMTSGKIVGSMIGNASKILARGAVGAEKMAEIEALTAQGMKLPQALEKVASTLKVADKANQYLTTSIIAAGEAQMESGEAYKTGLEKLTSDFIAKNNREPLDFEKEDINRRAASMANTTFAANMAILGLSDTIQFGNALTKGFKAETRAMAKTRIVNGVEQVVDPSTLSKVVGRTGRLGAGVVTEGIEEGSQLFTQKSSQDYFSRKNDLDAKSEIDDLLHATAYGVGQLMGSKEGLESMLLGAVTGGGSHVGMSALSGQLGNEWNKESIEADRTKVLLDTMQDFSAKSLLTKKIDGAVRNLSIQESMNQAVKDNDAFQFYNLKHDRLKSMVQVYNEAGRLPRLKEKLDELTQLSDTEFLELFPDADLDRKSIGQYVGTLKTEVDRMSKLWDDVDTRFQNSSDSQKVQLWSALTNIGNRKKREDELSLQFAKGALVFPELTVTDETEAEEIKQFKARAKAYLDKNGDTDFTEREVNEYFQLREDRKANVRLYSEMKEGRGFIVEDAKKAKPPVVKPPVTKPGELAPTVTPTVTAPKAPASGTPVTPPTGNTPPTGSAPKAPTNSQESKDILAQMIAVNKKKERGEKLTPAETLLRSKSRTGGTPSIKLTQAEQEAYAEFDKLYAAAMGDLSKIPDGTTSPTPPTPPVVDPAVEAEKKKKEAIQATGSTISALVGKLNIINGALDKAKSSEDLKKAATAYGALTKDIDAIKQTATDLGIKTDILDQLVEAILPKLPKVQTGVVKKSPANPAPTNAGKPFVVDKNKPLRIVVDDVIRTNDPRVDAFYKSLETAVGDMPDSRSSVMQASVEYDADKDHYNVWINPADTTKESKMLKIGYLQNIDQNRERYDGRLLNTLDSLRTQAKERGLVDFEIEWKFGLNNTVDRPQPLSKSVFNRDNIIGIYRNKKTGLSDEMRAKNLLNNSKASLSKGEDFFKAGIKDGYVLEVKDPAGNVRLIGMSGMPASSDQDWDTLHAIMDINNPINGEANTDTQVENLKKNFWIAAARPLDENTPPYSVNWQLSREGTPYLAITENARDESSALGATQGQFGKDGISIKIDMQGVLSQADFVGGLSVFPNDLQRFEALFPGKTVKDVLAANPLRLEIPEDMTDIPLDRFNLSVDGRKPWNVAAHISSIPAPVIVPAKAAKEDKSPKVEENQPVHDPNATPPKRSGRVPKKKEVDLDLKVSTNSPVFQRDLSILQKELKKILPKGIKVQDLTTLLNGFYSDGRTWGAFSENIIYLAKSAGLGTHYHEAFHAVFQSAMTPQERAYLIDQLSESGLVDVSDVAIDQFINSRNEYRDYSREKAAYKIKEEALADLFMAYMNNRSQQGIFAKLKTLFDRLLSWIGFVRGNKSEIDQVFDGIARGKYRNRVAQEAGSDISFKSLDSLTSDQTSLLVGMVRQNLLDRWKKGMNPREVMTDLIDQIRTMPQFSKPWISSIHTDEWLDERDYDINEEGTHVYPAIFNDPESIIKEVEASLRLFKLQVTDTQILVDMEDDSGKRTKDIEYDTNTFSMTGFDRLDAEVKRFLMQIGTQEEDGLLIPLSVLGTYSQLQRMLAGTESYADMLGIIDNYASSNTEMQLVYDKLVEKGTDKFFQESFRNAFTLSYADHYHLDVNQETGEHKLYAANRADTGQLQLERYKRNYERLIAGGSKLTEEKEAVIKIAKSIARKMENGEEVEIYSLKSALDNIGIEVSESFLTKLVEGKEQVDDKVYSFDDFYDDLVKIKLGMAVGNPYAATQADIDDEGGPTAEAISRVKRIGQLDAMHRNDVYQTSFLNSEGETVYSFTKPNYELVRGLEIEKGVGFDTEFLKNNYFVKSFNQKKAKTPNYLRVSIFGGLREQNKDTGVTSRKIDAKSKLLSEHMLYSNGFIEWARHEAKSTFTVVNTGNKDKFTTSDGSLNAVTLQAWKDFVQQDVDRIKQVVKELQTLDPKTQWIEGYHFKGKESRGYDPITKLPIAPDLTNPETWGNGLKMMQFPQLQQVVENLMKTNEGMTLEQAVDEIVKVDPTTKKSLLDDFLPDQHKQMTEAYLNTLKNEGIDVKKNFKLMAGQFADSYAGPNKENLYIADYVAGTYTMANAYEQLSSGEQAYYANHVDITKRRAAMLAAGNSRGEGSYSAAMISDSFSQYNPKTGETNPLDYFDKGVPGFKKVNKSDAQSYMTAKQWRFTMFKLGKLSPKLDAIIGQMIQGREVSVEDQKEVMEFATANSIKNVYFDGKVYVKTSIVPLFPNLTSKLVDGRWVPKDGFLKLHLLRTSMEKNGIDEVYRESAMKLQRFNKTFEDKFGNFTFDESSKFTLENRFWREQVNNPSGKMKITLGTQLLQLIDSEMNDADEVEYNGKLTSIGDVRKAYQKLLADATLDSNTRALQLFKKIQVGDKMQTPLFSILRSSAAASGTTDTALDYYNQNNEGRLTYGVNLPHMSEVFEQGILSYFNKNVFGKKVPGMKLTLVSSDGIQVKDSETNEYRDLRIHRLKDGKIEYAEAMLSEEMLYKYDLTAETFAQQSPEIQDEILSMLGFRIPTQSHHSMIPFKVVGFVPAIYGSVIFAPSEVTWLAGSDFDVDSLFVNRKEFYMDKEGKLHIYGRSKEEEVQHYEWKKNIEKNDKGFEIISKEFKRVYPNKKDKEISQLTFEALDYPYSFEAWTEKGKPQSMYSYNNGVLDTMLSFMRNPANFESIFTPASMNSMADMAEEIGGLLEESENSSLPYNFAGSLFSHWKNNSTGKANVGPAANASKTSAFMTKLGVELKFAVRIGDAISTGYAGNEEIQSSTVDANTDKILLAKETLRKFTENVEAKNTTKVLNDLLAGKIDADIATQKVSKFRKSEENKDALEFIIGYGQIVREGATPVIKSTKSGRKADSLSTLVSAMTDNAKERLAAKLNLTVDNLPVFGNMLALGFGMRRTMIFANQPILRKLSQKVMNAKSHLLKEGSSWEISQAFRLGLEKSMGLNADELNTLKNSQFTDAQMLAAINPTNMDFISRFADNEIKISTLTQEQKDILAVQYQILSKFIDLEKDTIYFKAVNTVLNTNKGPKPSYEAYDTLMEKKALLQSNNSPFEIWEKIVDKAKSISSNMDIAEQNEDQGNEFFIHRTTRFSRLQGKLTKWGRMSENKRKSLKRGYITDLAMSMFNKSLLSVTKGQTGRASELKDFIHLLTASPDVTGEKANIVTKFNQILADYPELKENLALQQLNTKTPSAQNNLYRLEYNTSMRTDPEFKEQLMSSITELSTFGEDKMTAGGILIKHPVRKFYEELYIYLALKDSMQFKTNSFVSLLAPSRFAKLASSLNQAQAIMRSIKLGENEKDVNTKFWKLTGKFPREFESQFLQKWVKGYEERKGWKQVDVDGTDAVTKKLIHPVLKGTTTLDYSKLVLDKKIGRKNFEKLFRLGREKNIMNEKGIVDYPLVLQTAKGPQPIDSQIPDYVYQSDVQLWVRTDLKDGVATYEKVNMSNFNSKLSPYGFPVSFEVPKNERPTAESRRNDELVAEAERAEEEARLIAESEAEQNDTPDNSSEDDDADSEYELPAGVIIPERMQAGVKTEEKEEENEEEEEDDFGLPPGIVIPSYMVVNKNNEQCNTN